MYRGVFEHPEGRKKQKPAVFPRSEKKQIGKQSSTPAAAAWNASADEGRSWRGDAQGRAVGHVRDDDDKQTDKET